MEKKKDIVDIYMEVGDFRRAVHLSGLPIHVAHLKLLKSGCLKIKDKIRYGSHAAKMGGMAEELFQKLVPEAVDANKYFQRNNPQFDFHYKGLEIDVKYSSLRKLRDKKRGTFWSVKANAMTDFIVAFLEREKGAELENPFILLLPTMFLDVEKKVHISQSGAWFTDFQVKADKLEKVLTEYAQLRKEGEF